MNTPIYELHAALVTHIDALSNRLADETDLDLAQGIATEIDEATHRLRMVGRQLFTEHTNTIAEKIDTIKAAANEAAQRLESIDTLRDLVRLSTGVLTLVDAVVDEIKALP